MVPFVAVFLMPGAVAGATLMARELLGEESQDGEDESEGSDESDGETVSGGLGT